VLVKFLLIALLVLALTAAVAIFIAIFQSKKAKKAAAEMAILHDAFWVVKEKAQRLQKALDTIAEIEGDANVERKELAQTHDSDLVNRANNLFS
jgi:uncharacterized protein (UPF0333 family)